MDHWPNPGFQLPSLSSCHRPGRHETSRSRALRFLEGLPQVALGLARHLRHDLWTVDQEEEGACADVP